MRSDGTLGVNKCLEGAGPGLKYARSDAAEAGAAMRTCILLLGAKAAGMPRERWQGHDAGVRW